MSPLNLAAASEGRWREALESFDGFLRFMPKAAREAWLSQVMPKEARFEGTLEAWGLHCFNQLNHASDWDPNARHELADLLKKRFLAESSG
jgi:hypothetical protein